MDQEHFLVRILRRLLRSVDGATAVEYAALLAVVSLAGVIALQGIGDQLQTTFSVTSSAWADSNNR